MTKLEEKLKELGYKYYKSKCIWIKYKGCNYEYWIDLESMKCGVKNYYCVTSKGLEYLKEHIEKVEKDFEEIKKYVRNN